MKVKPFVPPIGGNSTAQLRIHIETGQTSKWAKGELEELQQKFKDTYGVDLDKSLARADARAAKDALIAIQKELQENPELANTLTTVAYNGRLKRALAQVSTSHNKQTGMLQSELALGSAYNSYDVVQKNRNDSRGYHPPNTDTQSIAAHEMGHVYEAALANKYGSNGMQRYIALKNDTHSASIVTHAQSKTGGSAKDISRYAETDSCETLAESFCDVYANGSNAAKISIEIVNETKRRLKE